MTDWVDEILMSQNRLLRKTELVDEVATSSKQKKVVLLALTVLNGYFFSSDIFKQLGCQTYKTGTSNSSRVK